MERDFSRISVLLYLDMPRAVREKIGNTGRWYVAKMEKTTPINPITIGIREPHRKMGGHEHETGMVTKARRGGYVKDMLIFRVHEQLPKNYHFELDF